MYIFVAKINMGFYIFYSRDFLQKNFQQRVCSKTLLSIDLVVNADSQTCGQSYKAIHNRNLRLQSCTDQKIAHITTLEGFCIPHDGPSFVQFDFQIISRKSTSRLHHQKLFSYRKKIIFQTCFIASSVRICDKFLNVVTFVTIQLTVDLLGSSLFSFFHC